MKRIIQLGFVCCFITALAFSANAADFKLGQADCKVGLDFRVDAGYQVSDLGDVAAGEEDSKTDYFTETVDNRLNLAVNYNDVSAFFEAGLATSSITSRHIYASYDMKENGKVLVGQTWSLLDNQFLTRF